MSEADNSQSHAESIDTPQVLLEHHLKALRPPTILREYDKVAQQCAAEDIDYPRFLLRITELELRTTNVVPRNAASARRSSRY